MFFVSDWAYERLPRPSAEEALRLASSTSQSSVRAWCAKRGLREVGRLRFVSDHARATGDAVAVTAILDDQSRVTSIRVVMDYFCDVEGGATFLRECRGRSFARVTESISRALGSVGEVASVEGGRRRARWAIAGAELLVEEDAIGEHDLGFELALEIRPEVG